MIERKELEIEQILKYIKKNPDVSIADISKELMFPLILITNIVCYLIGAKKIVLHRILGKSELYKYIKENKEE